VKKVVFAAALVAGLFTPATFAQSITDLRVGTVRPGGRYEIRRIPLETYVARVLAGEAARNSPPAALEALAISIRTFALAHAGRHRADGFDLCDQTHCQVLGVQTAATERAANATAGEFLERDGVPAAIYYTASCGGRTEIPSNVWPGADDPSFLPSQDDDACGGAPAWTAEISDADLVRALRSAGFRGERLKRVVVVSRNASGRVARLQVDGFDPGQISGQDFRLALGRTLGWQHIKSTAFDLVRRPGGYRFSGHGSGHGVGLCVIGSVRLAANGWTAPEILGRYFPGLPVSRLDHRGFPGASGGRALATRSGPPPVSASPADVVVTLPSGHDGERDALAQLARQARDDLARSLGVPPPGSVSIRVHPTVGAYQRATGEPWFTPGVLVETVLHLPPLAELRDRGVLDRAIRRQLVHLMIGPVLAGRPAWVREGAALYFSDDQPPETAPDAGPGARSPLLSRTTCPADPELLRPVSPGAMTSAYARARACFARQIQMGKNWREIN
jgi:SpoIID/LytB domain protein